MDNDLYQKKEKEKERHEKNALPKKERKPLYLFV